MYTHTYIHTLIYIIYGYINIHKDSSKGLQEEMNGRQQQPGDTAWQFMIPPFYFRFEFFPNINFKKCFFKKTLKVLTTTTKSIHRREGFPNNWYGWLFPIYIYICPF